MKELKEGVRLDPMQWLVNALMLVLGAYVIFEMIQSFCASSPSFAQYGWALMAAYVAGVAFYLKHALRRRG